MTLTSGDRIAKVEPFLSGPRRFSKLWLGFIAACLLGGAVLRLTNLGKYGFWTDEYFHVFSAKSYLETGTTFVPMVGEYGRAKAVTLVTAGMFKVFGESETAARLPFALTNIFFLAFSAIVVRRFFSEIVSGAYTLALAFAPFAVEISRECRFYTAHQLFFFSAALALFAGFENVSGRLKKSGHKASVDWRWLIASAPLAALALHFQTLTVNLGIAAACYLVLMAAMTVGREGWRKASLSKYVIVIFLGVAGFLALMTWDRKLIMEKISEATDIHSWQVAKGYDNNFYRYYFINNFPAFTFLFPVGAYVAVKRYGKIGLYSICLSAPLLVLHSLVFARKSERYIFYLFPFFLITALIAIEPFIEWGWERLRISLKSEPLRAKVLAAAFILPGFLVFAHPWIAISFKVPFRAKHPDWKSLDEQFKRNVRGATVVTTNPQAFLYYVGKKPEFYRLSEINKRRDYEPTLIRNNEQFRDVLHRKGELYFVGAEWNFNNEGFMGESVRGAIKYLMSPVDHAGDRRILAYHK